MTSKYHRNCPVLEKNGAHYLNPTEGIEVCLNCLRKKCVIDELDMGKRGVMIACKLYPEKRRHYERN